MTKNKNRIRTALSDIGYQAKSIEWEQPTAPTMIGTPGGWTVDGVSIGKNIDEALAHIRLGLAKRRSTTMRAFPAKADNSFLEGQIELLKGFLELERARAV